MPEPTLWEQEYALRIQLKQVLRQLDALSSRLEKLGVSHKIEVDDSLLKRK